MTLDEAGRIQRPPASVTWGHDHLMEAADHGVVLTNVDYTTTVTAIRLQGIIGRGDQTGMADNQRIFAWVRHVATQTEQPYIVTELLSMPEMAAKLIDGWGGYIIAVDGIGLFDPLAVGSRLPGDDEDDEDSECGNTGWLVGQTYGATSPPDGASLVQRCDNCARFPGDLDAALAYARTVDGVVHAIGHDNVLAPRSDVWVEANVEKVPATAIARLVWHTVDEATANDWYEPPEGEPMPWDDEGANR